MRLSRSCWFGGRVSTILIIHTLGFICTGVRSGSISLEEVPETTTEDSFTTTETAHVHLVDGNELDWKVLDKKPNWVFPHIIWKLLGFPTAPNKEQSEAIQQEEELLVTNVDLSHYNVGGEDGVIKGTLPCECGIPAQLRVAGPTKEPARINDIPWTAAMVYKKSQQPFCGASLINDRYLLTAGHCLPRTNAEEIEIWFNDEFTLLSHETIERRLVYDVEEIIRHPKYKVFTNDIALVKLKGTVPLGDLEQIYLLNPVCIPTDNEQKFAEKIGTVAGWGSNVSNGVPSPILLKIDVPIISNERCVNESKYKNNVKESMMCAGNLESGGADSCQGDSGGPLIVLEDNRAKLVGIVSWGWGCAEPGRPGVYTRVGAYPEWILEHTKDAEWCQVKIVNNNRGSPK